MFVSNKKKQKKTFFLTRGTMSYKKGITIFFASFANIICFIIATWFPNTYYKALFGRECGLCKIVELRTKGKYSVTTTDAAAKVKESVNQKLNIKKLILILQKWI